MGIRRITRNSPKLSFFMMGSVCLPVGVPTTEIARSHQVLLALRYSYGEFIMRHGYPQRASWYALLDRILFLKQLGPAEIQRRFLRSQNRSA